MRLRLLEQPDSVDHLAKKSGVAYIPLFSPSKVQNFQKGHASGKYSSSHCSKCSSSSASHRHFSSQSSLSYSSLFRRSRSLSPFRQSCCSLSTQRCRSYTSQHHRKCPDSSPLRPRSSYRCSLSALGNTSLMCSCWKHTVALLQHS